MSTPPRDPGAPPPTLREASFDDAIEVYGLLGRLGLGVPTSAEGTRRAWDRLWKDNPALAGRAVAPPPGWVLEAEGRIVGFFGSIPIRYQLGDQPLLAGVASQWGVEKPFRGATDELAKAYFAQRGADLLLVTSAIRATGRIFARHGALVMPQRDYDRVLYWVLDAAGFLRAGLRKKTMRPALVSAAALGLSPLLAGVVALQRRRPGRPRAGLDPEAVPLSAIGDEFDDLWRRKLGERDRLFAARSAADLRWHLGPSVDDGAITVLRCRRGGRLEGYLVLYREEVEALGLVRAKIADLVVAGDDPVVLDALLAAAHEHARARGCHVLELVGMPRAVRAHAERYRPFSRTFPCSPFHYKPGSPALAARLELEAAWYPSLYDGDSCLG